MNRKYILLIVILALAATLRLIGINWDNGSHLHPDERFLTMVTTNITAPQTIRAYFDTQTSSFNPHNKGFSFYVYGTYPVHLTKIIALAINKNTYAEIPLVGRSLSAIMDILTVFFVFRIGKLLSEKMRSPDPHRAGLFSAFVYATMVLPIQLSHYYIVDPYAVLWLTISLYLILQKRLGSALGIAAGLSIATKISSVLILPSIVFMCMTMKPWKMNRAQLKTMMVSGIWFLSALYITIRLMYPYLFTGIHLNPLILNNWKELKAFDGPLTSFPPALQWIHISIWQPTMDMLVWGLGLPLGSIFGIALFYFIFKRHTSMYTLLLWIMLVIGYQSIQFAKAMRYIYPAYPAIAVLCGIFLSRIRINRYGGMVMYCLLLVWPLSFISIYQTPHTRITASTWIYSAIPPQATIAWEHWDDPLPLSIENNSISTYKTIQLPMYDPDSIEKWTSLSKILAATDYIILSSNRVYGGTGRAIRRYPYTHTYYTKLFRGSLGFTKVAEFTSRPKLTLPIRPVCISIPGFIYGYIAHDTTCTSIGIHIIDDYAEESFTVYDHPKVIILKNTQHLPSHELLTRIYE